MNDKLKSLHFEQLYEAILLMRTPEELSAFMDDLCTVSELKAMLQRLQVAELLDSGEQYSAIVSKTGASTATISRVNRCLLYGSDGYRLALDRLPSGESKPE